MSHPWIAYGLRFDSKFQVFSWNIFLTILFTSFYPVNTEYMSPDCGIKDFQKQFNIKNSISVNALEWNDVKK